MRRSLRLIASAIALLSLLALLPIPGSSYGIGLDVSPAKLEVTIPPGAFKSIPITVHNSSLDPVHIQVSLADFSLNLLGQYNFQRPGSRPDSLMRWATVRPREFDLPANTTQQVQFTLSIPDSKALKGEYAGVVFFQTRPLRGAGQRIAFSARVASKIYASIPGTVKINGAIVKMAALRSPIGEQYHVLFRNLGNAHVYLRGNLQIERNGVTVDRIPLPNQALCERGQDRLLEVRGKQLPAGSYQAIATIDYGGSTDTGGAIGFKVP